MTAAHLEQLPEHLPLDLRVGLVLTEEIVQEVIRRGRLQALRLRLHFLHRLLLLLLLAVSDVALRLLDVIRFHFVTISAHLEVVRVSGARCAGRLAVRTSPGRLEA